MIDTASSGAGTKVASRRPSNDDATGWKTAEELIGCVDGGPEDGAENHDRYLYGHDEER